MGNKVNNFVRSQSVNINQTRTQVIGNKYLDFYYKDRRNTSNKVKFAENKNVYFEFSEDDNMSFYSDASSSIPSDLVYSDADHTSTTTGFNTTDFDERV